MTPTHAVKNGTRYRYYVSRPLITKDQTDSSTGLRIPAADIEQLREARQPPALTADKLLAHSRLPLAWHDPRAMLGLA